MAGRTNTIKTLLGTLAPGFRTGSVSWDDFLKWPPDVFGIAAYLLHKTGGYRHAVGSQLWKKALSKHPEELTKTGTAWGKAVATQKPVPRRVQTAWKKLESAAGKPVLELDDECHKALLDLMALADEACVGFGLPLSASAVNNQQRKAGLSLLLKAEALLNDPFITGGASSLAVHLDPQMLCVLPKVRTPFAGLTIRSLSHHLAMWPRDEINPRWITPYGAQTQWDSDRFNLLLVPWPYQIKPEQFVASKEERCGRHIMHEDYRCFDYHPPDAAKWLKTEFPKLLELAKNSTTEKEIHGVIFPELAFASMGDLYLAYQQVSKVCDQAFLLAGVADDENQAAKPANNACFLCPLADAEGVSMMFTQAKHHRWQLDGAQIKQYQLTKRLQTGKLWWESTHLNSREQHFVAFKKWLTFSFLICEDLARQEPASRLVRAIGPNLIIALLLDGQQHNQRWPGRYAGVLAEDPGSSVLTFTSLGMVLLGKSKQHDEQDAIKAEEAKAAGLPFRSCNIGLWRESSFWQKDKRRGDAVPISICPEDHGVVLSLARREFDEYSADGRSAKASALVLDAERDIQRLRLP